jgi:Family of unknown function (DUF5365)
VARAMNTAYAATKEQEGYIHYLVNYFYTNIFPYYFADEQIHEFEKWQVLSLQEKRVKYNGTTKEAFQIISSLQSLITVIEYVGKSGDCGRYRDVFQRNVELLRRYGIMFPFAIEQFAAKQHYPCSMYLPSQSEWLM